MAVFQFYERDGLLASPGNHFDWRIRLQKAEKIVTSFSTSL
ncbi:hypothetical protein C723_0423 [Christiangramia flava JLT2011]|uniref:Uncharacterized protein n=1 Tax=Christiangramia flava JLT2011 TaxID=1229726 RepID=A0A1L7I3K6_9FLAO|nr:hypothetical protein GRFL_1475 [Christiangramia flava JLT2011]OSS41014.1 hypothetical protein C723_0423 [Christiangramia flava JLT2011]